MIQIEPIKVKSIDFQTERRFAHELLTSIMGVYHDHGHSTGMPMVRKRDHEENILRRMLRQFNKEVKKADRDAEVFISQNLDDEELFVVSIPCPTDVELVLDIGFLEPLSKINKKGAILLAKKIAITFYQSGFDPIDKVYDDEGNDFELEDDEKKAYAKFQKVIGKWAKIMNNVASSREVTEEFQNFLQSKGKKKEEIKDLYYKIDKLSAVEFYLGQRVDDEFATIVETYGLVWDLKEFEEGASIVQDRIAYFNIVKDFYYTNNDNHIGGSYCPFCNDSSFIKNTVDIFMYYENLCEEWKNLTENLLT